MENIVYNELVYRGFTITVFNNNGKEIDFLAERGGKKTYVQVAYSVVEEKTWKREFEAFSGIPVYDRKVIITNDDMDYSTSAVEHVRLIDFLQNESGI
jgi:predicted AAA+ superfamily ATPase